jgi:hypothetical protein
MIFKVLGGEKLEERSVIFKPRETPRLCDLDAVELMAIESAMARQSTVEMGVRNEFQKLITEKYAEVLNAGPISGRTRSRSPLRRGSVGLNYSPIRRKGSTLAYHGGENEEGNTNNQQTPSSPGRRNSAGSPSRRNSAAGTPVNATGGAALSDNAIPSNQSEQLTLPMVTNTPIVRREGPAHLIKGEGQFVAVAIQDSIILLQKLSHAACVAATHAGDIASGRTSAGSGGLTVGAGTGIGSSAAGGGRKLSGGRRSSVNLGNQNVSDNNDNTLRRSVSSPNQNTPSAREGRHRTEGSHRTEPGLGHFHDHQHYDFNSHRLGRSSSAASDSSRSSPSSSRSSPYAGSPVQSDFKFNNVANNNSIVNAGHSANAGPNLNYSEFENPITSHTYTTNAGNVSTVTPHFGSNQEPMDVPMFEGLHSAPPSSKHTGTTSSSHSDESAYTGMTMDVDMDASNESVQDSDNHKSNGDAFINTSTSDSDWASDASSDWGTTNWWGEGPTVHVSGHDQPTHNAAQNLNQAAADFLDQNFVKKSQTDLNHTYGGNNHTYGSHNHTYDGNAVGSSGTSFPGLTASGTSAHYHSGSQLPAHTNGSWSEGGHGSWGQSQNQASSSSSSSANHNASGSAVADAWTTGGAGQWDDYAAGAGMGNDNGFYSGVNGNANAMGNGNGLGGGSSGQFGETNGHSSKRKKSKKYERTGLQKHKWQLFNGITHGNGHGKDSKDSLGNGTSTTGNAKKTDANSTAQKGWLPILEFSMSALVVFLNIDLQSKTLTAVDSNAVCCVWTLANDGSLEILGDPILTTRAAPEPCEEAGVTQQPSEGEFVFKLSKYGI